MTDPVTVTLPSTMQLTIRPLRVSEENQLATARGLSRAKQEALLNRVLAACVQEVVDPGPYPLDAGAPAVPWDDALTGDRIAMMIALHRISYTDGEYLFVDRVQCTGCRGIYGHRVHIEDDLPLRTLTPQACATLRSGDAFLATVAGHTVAFALQSGQTDRRYEKLREMYRGERDITAALRARILDVTAPDGTRVDRQEVADWIDGAKGKHPGLSSADAEALRDAMDAVDCGYDLDVEAICPDCGYMTVFALPFDAVFAPGTARKERRRARRGSTSSGG